MVHDPSVRVVAIYEPMALIFLGQHDRDHSLGDGWVGRIGGMRGQRGVEIIDLEKDRVAIGFERSKVMFFVWIVGVAKIVIDFDCLDDASDSLGRAATPGVMKA